MLKLKFKYLFIFMLLFICVITLPFTNAKYVINNYGIVWDNFFTDFSQITTNFVITDPKGATSESLYGAILDENLSSDTVKVHVYDEEFYYMVQSIILGHHGEFGDKPRTAFAYASHLLDMVDSQVTGMLDKIDAGDVKKSGLGTSTIFENGGYIAIMSEE